ncbi:MAG: ankyrin repeat domain-containing protein [Tatlockia sp.]|nr:ankyrin repeat domain-containing protein [Tatlockia sp.]
MKFSKIVAIACVLTISPVFTMYQSPSTNVFPDVSVQNYRAVKFFLREAKLKDVNALLLYFAEKYNYKTEVTRLLDCALIQPETILNTILFFAAAENGQLDLIELLLKRGIKVESKNDSGMTALHLALVNNHRNIAKLLLEEYRKNLKLEQSLTDLESLLPNENTISDVAAYFSALLKWAIKYKKEALIKSLLLDNKGLGTTGLTPLHFAIKEGYIKIAEFLLSKGADVNAVDNDKQTPLHYAVRYDRPDILLPLFTYKSPLAAQDNDGDTPLHLAAQDKSSLVMAKLLIDKGAQIDIANNKNNTPLLYATGYNASEIVKLLIDKGANVNHKGDHCFTPLHLAAQEGHTAIVQLLIDNKADLTAQTGDKSTALHMAIAKEHTDIAQLLIVKGSTIDARNQNNCTPLYLAIRSGKLSAVKLLIDKGADINALSTANQSLLYASLVLGYEEIAQWLLDKGIKVVDVQETSTMLAPLHLAAQKNYITVAKALLDKGADINIKDIKGKTPLHLAIENNHLVMAKLLITQGAHINAKDNDNCTPLFKSYSNVFIGNF